MLVRRRSTQSTRALLLGPALSLCAGAAQVLLCLCIWLAAADASATPVIWELEFVQAGQSVGGGTFSYDPDSLDMICPAECDDPTSPFYTPYVDVYTRLESFSAVIEGYALGLDAIAWWNDPPDHLPGHIAYSTYGPPSAVENYWFFGDPYFGDPHQFTMSNFSEQADGSWIGDWSLSVVPPSPLIAGGEWRATMVPEPGTIILLASGLVVISARQRRHLPRRR